MFINILIKKRGEKSTKNKIEKFSLLVVSTKEFVSSQMINFYIKLVDIL